MEHSADAFDVMLGLLILLGPFVLVGVFIGYLVRNKRAEGKERRNMEDRLDLALKEQRLHNLRREQALEDELFEHQKRRLTTAKREERLLDDDLVDVKFASRKKPTNGLIKRLSRK